MSGPLVELGDLVLDTDSGTGNPDAAFSEPGLGDLHLDAEAGEPELAAPAVPDPVQLDLELSGVDMSVVFRPGLQFILPARALAAMIIDAGLIIAGHIGSETPADLQSRLPYIRVLRVAGGSDLVNDYAQVDLEVFAATSLAGEQLAESIRQYLTLPAPPYTPRYLIDRIECLSGAAELPWADTRLRRYGATYRVVSRRQPAAI
ncbi:MAG: hypothetical protein ABWY93_18895 [Mycobacterium sp.]